MLKKAEAAAGHGRSKGSRTAMASLPRSCVAQWASLGKGGRRRLRSTCTAAAESNLQCLFS